MENERENSPTIENDDICVLFFLLFVLYFDALNACGLFGTDRAEQVVQLLTKDHKMALPLTVEF